MFYIIYKTINQINGKFYIGKHQTKDLDDGYVGSGKLLQRAIKKHGIDNFTTEILEIYDNERQMNLAEKILVVCDPEVSYNLCPGGQGGWGYVNKNGIGISDNQKDAAKTHCKTIRSKKYKEWLSSSLSENEKILWKQNISKSKLGNLNPRGFKGKTHSEEIRQKISRSSKGKIPWNKGIPRSEETKRKISESLKNNA